MNASNEQAGELDPALYRRYLAALTLFHQAAADSAGLSGTDYQASNLLDLDGPMTSGELARRLGLSLAAGSRLADRLIEAGIARRSHDTSDRRRVVIEHTGALPESIDHALRRVREPIARALAALSDEQLSGVGAYLTAAADTYAESARSLRDSE
ncbi:MarR family winged helix-turn-helix transcriptional regulator [Microbacterium sp. NPDC058342]|uniref:MarR family winged helix-turn-helix transcriptional regulator n=1 Tax=Microbacterium sp. NPDC058342 TaxID=3346454 RepID=UPI003653D7D3